MSIFRALRMKPVLMALLLVLSNSSVAAENPRIAILDFELNDISLGTSPDSINPEEIGRTKLLKPLLSQALAARDGYTIVPIDEEAQRIANAGFGYLFDHHDVAAELGKKFDADWIVVGRNHKASFLFVYFKAHLINTKTQQLVGDFTAEVKGQQKKITPKGVARLAEQIDETIRAQSRGSLP